jgi:hypothetical protein
VHVVLHYRERKREREREIYSQPPPVVNKQLHGYKSSMYVIANAVVRFVFDARPSARLAVFGGVCAGSGITWWEGISM